MGVFLAISPCALSEVSVSPLERRQAAEGTTGNEYALTSTKTNTTGERLMADDERYDGQFIDALCRTASVHVKRTKDDYGDLCELKTALANKKYMTPQDEKLWNEADRLQEIILQHDHQQ
jgi:hypothetical protein